MHVEREAATVRGMLEKPLCCGEARMDTDASAPSPQPPKVCFSTQAHALPAQTERHGLQCGHNGDMHACMHASTGVGSCMQLCDPPLVQQAYLIEMKNAPLYESQCCSGAMSKVGLLPSCMGGGAVSGCNSTPKTAHSLRNLWCTLGKQDVTLSSLTSQRRHGNGCIATSYDSFPSWVPRHVIGHKSCGPTHRYASFAKASDGM